MTGRGAPTLGRRTLLAGTAAVVVNTEPEAAAVSTSTSPSADDTWMSSSPVTAASSMFTP